MISHFRSKLHGAKCKISSSKRARENLFHFFYLSAVSSFFPPPSYSSKSNIRGMKKKNPQRQKKNPPCCFEAGGGGGGGGRNRKESPPSLHTRTTPHSFSEQLIQKRRRESRFWRDENISSCLRSILPLLDSRKILSREKCQTCVVARRRIPSSSSLKDRKSTCVVLSTKVFQRVPLFLGAPLRKQVRIPVSNFLLTPHLYFLHNYI